MRERLGINWITDAVENEIIPYIEMCQREGASLQRGMNFGLGKGYSVILMSVRPNAPYRDKVEDDGSTLIYEGHDALAYNAAQWARLRKPLSPQAATA